MMKSMITDFDPSKHIKILENYCCMRCRGEVKVAEMKMMFGPNKGEHVTQTHGCDCDLLDGIKELQRKARASKLQSIFEENSLVNSSLMDSTFHNFDTSEFNKAYQQAKRFADEFDINNPRNLFFQGSFGTGKSHLSIAITKAIKEKGYSAIFISIPKLLTKIRNTYNKNSQQTEQQIIDMISSVDLVVFDDIGSEGDASGWGSQKIFEVIDQRAGKHNIYTTNLSSKDFEASLDLHRIFSRMMMNAEPVIMKGTDYRRKQFLRASQGGDG